MIFIPIFTIILLLIVLSIIYKEDYNQSITIEEIPIVLNRYIAPKLPEGWKIKSIQKIDDGFVSPSVKIKYSNNIILGLYSSKPSYPKMKEQSTLIGNTYVTIYKGNSATIYLFFKDNIYYSLKGTSENSEKILEYIKQIN
jgi:hypothetical protein